MSDFEKIPSGYNPLASLSGESFEPADLMAACDLGPDSLGLLTKLREDEASKIAIDGFRAANAVLHDGGTLNDLGASLDLDSATRQEVEDAFFSAVDMSGTHVPVRDREIGESVDDYLRYMDQDVLRLRGGIRHPLTIALPEATDAPGARFIYSFPPDNDKVAMGRVAIGDLDGAHSVLTNNAYLIRRLRGLLPNFNHISSLDRGNPLLTSYALERTAAAAGSDGAEILAEFKEPLEQQIAFWQRGRSYLKGITHYEGASYGRQILLADSAHRHHDIVYRHYSDIQTNLATLQGIRPESAAEDAELMHRILGNLTGRAAEVVFEQTIRDVRAACEWQDFADWELGNYKDLDTIRTTGIAPAHLQANMVHNLRMVGRFEEAKELADVLNRRFWVDIDEDHGYYADLLSDGTPTKAVHAAQFLVLLAGGIVPPERKPKLRNTLRDALMREYGFIISAGASGQQWSGSPSETGDRQKDNFVRKIQERMYGEVPEIEGEDRTWAALCSLLVEASVMAATEEQLAGRHGEADAWLDLAEEARVGTVKGIEGELNEFGFVSEKYSATNPKKFINGGEYGKTLATAQRGFGMTIGAYRNLAGRGLQAEVMRPWDYSWRQYTLRHTVGGLAVAEARPTAAHII